MTHSTANPGLPLTTKASLKLLGVVVPEGVNCTMFPSRKTQSDKMINTLNSTVNITRPYYKTPLPKYCKVFPGHSEINL